eukprot:Tbor_TRINITY_DN5474_c1_g1::TRINITY_DN5474_c1_g1_i1::g.24812::m.24812
MSTCAERTPSRQKNAEELEQERRDEEFARQLQEQINIQPVPVANLYDTNPIAHNPQTTRASNATVASAPRIACNNCRSINNVPTDANTTQFLCGYCNLLLVPNQGPEGTQRYDQLPQPSIPHRNPVMYHQPHPQQTSSSAQEPILQGTSPQNVQVRCGQCSSVNSVLKQQSRTTQFICGACQSVNEVNT